jgi:hypothetical protein
MSMSNQKTPGRAFDAAITARYRLGVAHWVLGLLGASSLWTRIPDQDLFHAFASGAGMVIALQFALGWVPYLVSWFYSKSLLDSNSRGVFAFTIVATFIALAEFTLNHNLLGFYDRPSPYLVVAGVALSLITMAKLCSLIRTPTLE